MNNRNLAPAFGTAVSEMVTIEVQPIPAGVKPVRLVAAPSDEHTKAPPISRRKKEPSLLIPLPSDDEFVKLPHYAVIAYAVRCVKRFLPTESQVILPNQKNIQDLVVKAILFLEFPEYKRDFKRIGDDIPLTPGEFNPYISLKELRNFLQRLNFRYEGEILAHRLSPLLSDIIDFHENFDEIAIVKRLNSAKEELLETHNTLAKILSGKSYQQLLKLNIDSLSSVSDLNKDLLKNFKLFAEIREKTNQENDKKRQKLLSILDKIRRIAIIAAESPLEIIPLCEDFQRLLRLSKKYAWTDETQVPPGVFGPMWPYGRPAWAKAKKPPVASA